MLKDLKIYNRDLLSIIYFLFYIKQELAIKPYVIS